MALVWGIALVVACMSSQSRSLSSAINYTFILHGLIFNSLLYNFYAVIIGAKLCTLTILEPMRLFSVHKWSTSTLQKLHQR